jgi:hypothetical protein
VGKRNIYGLGMIVYTCNPSTLRLMQEDHRFEASLGYIELSSKKKEE